MKQYLDLVSTVLSEGTLKPNRTGIDTISYFAYPFRHDLKDGFPLLTTKKMDGSLWNSVVHELLWFISGENHIRNFREKSKIWNAWADDNGDLETAYGWYWRHFPHTGGEMLGFPGWDSSCKYPSGLPTLAQYIPHTDCRGNFDQLGYCIEQLKTNPNNRRLVVSAWEPYNAHKSKLPPCHLLYIFNVQDGRLCLHMTQRSCDVGLGVPFNVASYALLMHIIAQETGLEPGVLSIIFVDAHIYYEGIGSERAAWDHSRVLKEQLLRSPYDLPEIDIAKKSIDNLRFDDILLSNYRSHSRLKMKVAV